MPAFLNIEIWQFWRKNIDREQNTPCIFNLIYLRIYLVSHSEIPSKSEIGPDRKIQRQNIIDPCNCVISLLACQVQCCRSHRDTQAIPLVIRNSEPLPQSIKSKSKRKGTFKVLWNIIMAKIISRNRIASSHINMDSWPI